MERNKTILKCVFLVFLFGLQVHASVLDSIKSIRVQVLWNEYKQFDSLSTETDFQITQSARSPKINSPPILNILKRSIIRKIDSSELIGVCMDGPDNDAYMEIINILEDTLIMHFSCAANMNECNMYDKAFLQFGKPLIDQKIADNANRYKVTFNKEDQIKLFRFFYSIRKKAFGIEEKSIPLQEFRN